MMKITGLSHIFKWENLHNWWLTKYFLPHCITSGISVLFICLMKSLHARNVTRYVIVF